jgi:hypothetical protein
MQVQKEGQLASVHEGALVMEMEQVLVQGREVGPRGVAMGHVEELP